MKFAALGRTQLLYDSIRAAQRSGHEPVLIATSHAAPEYSVDADDFARLATDVGCVFLAGSRLVDDGALRAIEDSGAEVAISVNWPTLIPATVRTIFRHGIINAHAGDLPRYRGNAAPNWAILAGEDAVVLTLHEMADELDAGPVYLKRSFPLREEAYVREVYDFLERAAPDMFVEILSGLEAGTLVPQPQDPSIRPLRAYPRLPRDGRIDWTVPAADIARLVRASAEPFAGAYTYLGLDRLVVWRACVAPAEFAILGVPGQVAHRTDTGAVAVVAGEGLLLLEEVENGSGRCKAGELIRSARDRLGLDLERAIDLLARLHDAGDAAPGGGREAT
jgi:UDP-4-amino-4-deoxy-L-arabinose formyltransferase/UDP-glucuronic acid dehydrogenase (UDP-4-keto-hexauronic acid decarboxylating)